MKINRSFSSYPFFFSMTVGAQQSLRRIMELYSKTTRFALACNTSNKIIEPIQSRCSIFKFKKLEDDMVEKRLLEICELENVNHYHNHHYRYRHRYYYHKSNTLV